VTHILWTFYDVPDSAAGVTLATVVAALIASALALLVAPSRLPFAIAVASFVVAAITLVLWLDAMWSIAESS